MDESIIQEAYIARGASADEIQAAIETLRSFESWLEARGASLAGASARDMRDYLEFLAGRGTVAEGQVLALARYLRGTGRDEAYIYLTSIYGIEDIVMALAEHTVETAGTDASRRIFGGLEVPPLGTPPERIHPMTSAMLERMREVLPPEARKKALTANAHRIPAGAFSGERERFLELGVDAYLEDYHRRKVDELERHAAEGKVWFEQRITPRVVDWVRGQPEVLGAVRNGDTLYATKIPYDPDAWLGETKSLRKRYLACHCPLARASILEEGRTVSPELCYCSAGFEKLLFDAITGEDLEVEVLESALAGSARCRFAIKLPAALIPDGGSRR
jgi:hypothetical protein